MEAMASRRTLDLSVPLHRLPAWVYGLSLVLLVVPLLPYVALYGLDRFLGGAFGAWQVPAALLLIVAHEAVHALGWKLAGGLAWRQFKFGVAWRALAPYCHATAPMPVAAYRLGAVLPLIVTGIVPALLALAAGDAGWTFLSAIMISAAVGDIFVLWTLRHIPAGAQVEDHPSQAGCVVHLEAAA
ncbi:MAG: DUF3267 domain-containing protein [Anaerolineae bacterium]|nr:DUF3267 domain-containing protein [Anaerolineae bacterium]